MRVRYLYKWNHQWNFKWETVEIWLIWIALLNWIVFEFFLFVLRICVWQKSKTIDARMNRQFEYNNTSAPLCTIVVYKKRNTNAVSFYQLTFVLFFTWVYMTEWVNERVFVSFYIYIDMFLLYFDFLCSMGFFEKRETLNEKNRIHVCKYLNSVNWMDSSKNNHHEYFYLIRMALSTSVKWRIHTKMVRIKNVGIRWNSTTYNCKNNLIFVRIFFFFSTKIEYREIFKKRNYLNVYFFFYSEGQTNTFWKVWWNVCLWLWCGCIFQCRIQKSKYIKGIRSNISHETIRLTEFLLSVILLRQLKHIKKRHCKWIARFWHLKSERQ